MSHKQTISLFLYLTETKEVILARRAKNQSLSGVLQATVHGAIEDGETSEEALSRELYEETGLSPKDLKKIVMMGEQKVGRKIAENCVYYMAALDETKAAGLEPNDEIREFLRLRAVDLERVVTTDYAKEESIDPKDAYVMFEDERAYLADVFNHLI